MAARTLTDTERNWLYSVGILAGSLLIFGAIYSLEMNQGRWNEQLRVVYKPSETVMRLYGVAHVLIATLYLATSRRVRSWRSSLAVALAGALGVGVCFAFAGLGGLSPRIASTAFFLYFIVHDFRDQVYFYLEFGDAPARMNREVTPRLLFWIPLSVVLGAFVLLLLATLAAVPGTGDLQAMLASLPSTLRLAAGGLLVAATVGSLIHIRRLWPHSGEGDLVSHFLRHRPIYTVFAGTLLLVVVGGFITRHNHVIVILHVTAWYVFYLRRLRSMPHAPKPPRWSWQWLRATPAGFNVLHLGTLALLATAAVIWVYVYRSDPALTPLWATLDVSNFQYWTLIHVTLSFRAR